MTAAGHEIRDYPFGPVDRLDLDPALFEVCGEHPVLRVRLPFGGDGWLVTRYADVRTVLSDPASAARPPPATMCPVRWPSPRPRPPSWAWTRRTTPGCDAG